jgi:anti-sigma-K factor RskA
MMTNEQDIAPTEIEALLPWYAAGTLRRRDRQRVEAALRDNPDLARQAELAREELAETISCNESIDVPTARVMDRLMAGIDEETRASRKPASPRVMAGRFATFVAGFTPRTLAIAASVACLAIALQASVLVSLLTRPAAEQSVALNDTVRSRGTYAMVRFAREASAAEITRFLESNQATLVDGPRPGGVYRVRIAVTKLAREEFTRVVSHMRQDRVVASAEPAEPAE